ncbi:MAG: cysteine--tRNA ligase [Candidatus Heimdallarchaeota archaeon]|nr:cysteine--tRNA ligase [Candidatus Heimdallarchaeota archaeon]
MTLKVRNSLTKKIEEFIPLNDKKVGMYTCGPTVYDTPHIGNYRTFFMADMIRRYLEFKGYEVKHIMNITDIDDKTIRDSAKTDKSLEEFTQSYTQIFFEGIDWLNIKRAHVYPRATEHVEEMIELVKTLEQKGYAYESEDGVYFDIAKFDAYGTLANIDLSQQKIGDRARADEYDKEHVQDFVLWKKSTPEEIERGIYYESPWGKGRPGWHIECSVMSMKYLGETIDIHTGAVDLKFPHHENEIAQSEAATGKPFVRYWLHGEFLNLKGEKMSKSLGNITTLHNLMDKVDPDTIRYLFLSTRYDAILHFNEDKLIGAKNSAERLRTTLQNVTARLRAKGIASPMGEREKGLLKEAKKAKEEFTAVMDNNFDTPKGLNVLHELSKAINKYLKGSINEGVLLDAFDVYKLLLSTYGLFEHSLEMTSKEDTTVEELMRLIIDLREEARKKKDYETSDKIRDKLAELGIVLEDTSKGTVWKLEHK